MYGACHLAAPCHLPRATLEVDDLPVLVWWLIRQVTAFSD